MQLKGSKDKPVVGWSICASERVACPGESKDVTWRSVTYRLSVDLQGVINEFGTCGNIILLTVLFSNIEDANRMQRTGWKINLCLDSPLDLDVKSKRSSFWATLALTDACSHDTIHYKIVIYSMDSITGKLIWIIFKLMWQDIQILKSGRGQSQSIKNHFWLLTLRLKRTKKLIDRD